MRILSELFPDVMNLHYEASGYKPHMGWTVAADVVHHSDFPFRNGALTLWRGGGGVGLPMTHSWDTYRDLPLAEGSYFTPGFTPSRGKPHPKLGQCGEIKTCPPCLNLGQILRAVPTLELLIKLIVTSLPNALEFNFLHPSLLLLLPCRRFPQQHSPINSLHRVSSPSLFHGKLNLR